MRVRDGRVLAVANPKMSTCQLQAPGSIFKLVTAFAALQEGLVDRDRKFQCDGWKTINGIRLNCTLPDGHGDISFAEAIAQSCNITFYGFGVRLGATRLLAYSRAFGLNRRIPGYLGEQAIGRIPNPPSNPIDSARLSVGQAKGLSITLLEAGEMVRRIAADDVSLPNVDSKRIKRNLNAIRGAMRLAVLAGTCKNAGISGADIAGKTGSPEAVDDPNQRSAWFVGFAPYKKPEVVVVVFVNRGHGYDTAAPLARRIFLAYFRKER